MVEKMSFVIAHRLFTIVDANKILVVENGQIVEQGIQKKLLQKRVYVINSTKHNLKDKKRRTFRVVFGINFR